MYCKKLTQYIISILKCLINILFINKTAILLILFFYVHMFALKESKITSKV